jgi:hypothetical protein
MLAEIQSIFLLALSLTSAAARVPVNEAQARANFVSQPTAVIVHPTSITLSGPRASQQLVVTGKYADGSQRDLTALCEIMPMTQGLIAVESGGYLIPQREGATTLVVRAGGHSTLVPVTVSGLTNPEPVSFRHELVAAMSVGGCNMGACHGTPSGKNGFKLSLRGHDPSTDYLQLTRDVHGRRTDRLDADASLMLKKALGRVPHEGGARFSATSLPARIIRDWLTQGLRDDNAVLPDLLSLEILPGQTVLRQPARTQQLAVLAHFADGESRDVTRLSVFTSSDPALAKVSPTGFVEFSQRGEVAILCRYLDMLQSVRMTYLEPRTGLVWKEPKETNYIDKHVFAKLKLLGIPPSDLCADQEFVRRAFLDVCGILPTPDETTAFLKDTDTNKRDKLIDTLLSRPEYADFWTLKWADLLRSSRRAIQIKGTHVYQKWLRDHVAANTSFDRLTRDLLTATGNSSTNPATHFYRTVRDPMVLAETTAQLFLGIRMQCAKCHNHPFERWTQDDYYSLAAFFARVKQKRDPSQMGSSFIDGFGEVVFVAKTGEVKHPRTSKNATLRIAGGPEITLPAEKDRREALAEWLIAPDNPYFSKALANRVWFHLFGRGIVDPVDDFRDSNPAANDELLDALAKDLIKNKYDVKYLIRTIMRSRSYQLSTQTNDFNRDDFKYFSHAIPKLLSAEQLLDAVCAATAVSEQFPGLPLGTRATQLPDGEFNHIFLKTFGQPGRELACECERESDTNLAQALHLINGPTINEKLRSPNNRVGKLRALRVPEREMVKSLYVAAIGRPPSDDELAKQLEHVKKSADKRKAWEDVQWALLNSKEFLFRH